MNVINAAEIRLALLELGRHQLKVRAKKLADRVTEGYEIGTEENPDIVTMYQFGKQWGYVVALGGRNKIGDYGFGDNVRDALEQALQTYDRATKNR